MFIMIDSPYEGEEDVCPKEWQAEARSNSATS